MPKKNSINGIHAQRLKEIRPYINFNFDLRKPLTKYQKSRIKKYYDAIDNLTARPNKIYRPRTRDHLRKAQDYAQHPNLPGIKVAFIPTPDDNAKIEFDKKGRISVKTKHVRTYDIDFDLIKLINNPKEHIKEKTDQHPKARTFTIKAGEHEIPASYNRATLPKGVINLMEKYGQEFDESGRRNNHYFGNWLTGVKAHYFEEQDNYFDYLKQKEQKRNDLKRKRKAAREKQRRKRNK